MSTLSAVPAGDAARTTGDSAAERRLRLGLAGALLLALVVGSAGLSWDIQWHTFIGRDSFLTPPHILLYGGVAGAGLACLAAVLIETWRYWRRAAGVDDATTVPFLGLFHAPLGFFVAGLAILSIVVAAPLDNYWHQLYGLDVTLWAPFHVMGLIGGLVGTLGLVYVLSAEAARHRLRTERPDRAVLVLALISLSSLLRFLLTTLQPAQRQAPTTNLGPLHVLTLPVGLAFAAALVGVAAATLTGRRGMRWGATLTIGLAALVILALEVAAPVLVRAAASAGGYAYYSRQGPGVQATVVLLPFALLPAALLVDLARRLTTGAVLPALLAAVPAALVGAFVPLSVLRGVPDVVYAVPVGLAAQPTVPATAVAWGLLLALPAAALSGWLGGRLGTVWRWNQR